MAENPDYLPPGTDCIRFLHGARMLVELPASAGLTDVLAINRHLDAQRGMRHWSYVIDTASLELIIETSRTPKLRRVSIKRLFDSVKDVPLYLDIHHDADGDVTDSFRPMTLEQNDVLIQKGIESLTRGIDTVQMFGMTVGAIISNLKQHARRSLS